MCVCVCVCVFYRKSLTWQAIAKHAFYELSLSCVFRVTMKR